MDFMDFEITKRLAGFDVRKMTQAYIERATEWRLKKVIEARIEHVVITALEAKLRDIHRMIDAQIGAEVRSWEVDP